MVPELNEFAGLPMAAENPPNVTPAVTPSATTAASAAASPRRSAMTCLVSRISLPLQAVFATCTTEAARIHEPPSSAPRDVRVLRSTLDTG